MQLRGMNQASDVINFMSSYITKKLPSPVYDALVVKHSKFEFTVDEILTGLEFAINTLEYKTLAKSHVNTKSVTATSPKATSTYRGLVCQLCEGNHRVGDCSKYRSRDDIFDRVRRIGLCFNCLSKAHQASNCPSRNTCRNCYQRHHTLLCNQTHSSSTYHQTAVTKVVKTKPTNISNNGSSSHDTNTSSSSKPIVTANKSSSAKKSSSSTHKSSNANKVNTLTVDHTENVTDVVNLFNSSGFDDLPPAVMPTVNLSITRGKNYFFTRALLDTGSQRSFISSDLAQRLALPVVNQVPLRITTFGGEGETQIFDVVKLKVQVGRYRFTCRLIVHDKVGTTLHCPGILSMMNSFREKGYRIADHRLNTETIEDLGILFGIDYFHQIVTSVRTVDNLTAFVTPAGLVPFGQSMEPVTDSASVACNRILLQPEIEIDKEPMLENLWNLDAIGIQDERYTASEKQAMSLLTETLKKTGEGYSIKLPFKSEERPSVNFRAAHAQMNSLLQKLKSDLTFYENYQKVIDDYLERDFIESTPVESKVGCFLPHHAVFKESATTPLRIVFNASSRPAGGRSLNDCTLTGPTLTQKLHVALVKFRIIL